MYDVSSFLVNLSSFIFMGLHPICSFFSNIILDSYGIKYSIIFGLIMTIISALTRLFIEYSFYFFFLGQIFGAIGNPFITNSPAKISAAWFLPENVKNLKINLISGEHKSNFLIKIKFYIFFHSYILNSKTCFQEIIKY